MRAKCAHRVWGQFANVFEKSDIRPEIHMLIRDFYASIVYSNLRFPACLWQSATGKMTRPTIGS